jgi:hypothetical protein
MALKKYSKFYYGQTITKSNFYLNFQEAGSPLTATVEIGAFTLTSLANKIASALNAIGDYEYQVDIDRASRKYTISTVGGEPFSLLIFTGVNKTLSSYGIIGFTGVSDLTGSNSYTGAEGCGREYITQTPLANFVDFKYNKEKQDASVNETVEGLAEVISYATIERMKCDFPLITNVTPQQYIRETSSGVEELEDFLDYCITKAPLEFMEDYLDSEVYTTAILDKTSRNSKGVGYELKEKVRQSLPFYYEIKGLVFKKIEG